MVFTVGKGSLKFFEIFCSRAVEILELSVNRTSALVPYGDLALAVTRVVSLKNPIGIRKVSHLV